MTIRGFEWERHSAGHLVCIQEKPSETAARSFVNWLTADRSSSTLCQPLITRIIRTWSDLQAQLQSSWILLLRDTCLYCHLHWISGLCTTPDATILIHNDFTTTQPKLATKLDYVPDYWISISSVWASLRTLTSSVIEYRIWSYTSPTCGSWISDSTAKNRRLLVLPLFFFFFAHLVPAATTSIKKGYGISWAAQGSTM